MIIDTPGLEKHLEIAGLSIRALETSSSVLYILQDDSKIIFCNEAWDRFALQNQGGHLVRQSVLGTSVLDVTPGILRPFYADLFSRARISGQILEHDVELSSPEMFRLYHMRVLPIGGPYLCIENTRYIERPQENIHSWKPGTISQYKDETGYITICCHCRRTQRMRGSVEQHWDFVPEFLIVPPASLRNNLCPKCWREHYPANGM